jgi:Fe-S-cluster-containing hydrogenase component 2
MPDSDKHSVTASIQQELCTKCETCYLACREGAYGAIEIEDHGLRAGTRSARAAVSVGSSVLRVRSELKIGGSEKGKER